MFISERFRRSPFYEFCVELLFPLLAFLMAVILFIAVLSAAIYSAVSPPSCYAHGRKMEIEVSWGFWTDCMVNVRGTWLPWSEVVPVERDGKITFEPKPVVRLRDAR